jgi:YfiH family protein
MTTITLERLPLDGVEAFNVLRGDVMEGDNYSQYNLCDYTGDTAEHVGMSRDTLCASLGITRDRLVMPRQTHTAHVAVIDDAFMCKDLSARAEYLDNTDALVTALRGVVIGVNTADCVNVALVDAVHGITGVAHAGWKGSAARIARNTVEAMTRIGADAACIHAAIGASICQDCFEVGDEVAEHFAECGFDIARIMRRNAATGKAHISLWEANRIALVEAGVPSDNIMITGNCTRCNPMKYFSARRLGIKSGRTFTGIIRR